MVGALQILDVRKGQGPQAHGRGNRNDRAVFRLGGPVQQGCQLLRTERDMQVLHRVHPERFVGIGRGVGQKGQRGPHTPAAQLCGEDVASLSLRVPFSEVAKPLLADARFLQPHRSYVVNLAAAAQLSSGELWMRSGARVPIPRGREPAVRAAFRAFLEG